MTDVNDALRCLTRLSEATEAYMEAEPDEVSIQVIEEFDAARAAATALLKQVVRCRTCDDKGRVNYQMNNAARTYGLIVCPDCPVVSQ